MLSFLRKGLLKIFSKKNDSETWNEEELQHTLEELRELFLNADVHDSVVEHLFEELQTGLKQHSVQEGPLTGRVIMETLHNKLVDLFGNSNESTWVLHDRLNIWLVCGLQGHGKTTQLGKLAHFFRTQHSDRSVMLVGGDFQRPMAGKQLSILGEQVGVPVILPNANESIADFLLRAKEIAHEEQIDIMLVDTSGRLHIDQGAMNELALVNQLLIPDQKIFVLHAAKGSSVLEVAKTFHKKIGLTGAIITVLDSVAKGGCALSCSHVLGVPVFFEGTGEHMKDLQVFHPVSMADRIFGRGDMLNFTKKIDTIMNPQEFAEAKKIFFSGQFTFEDYLVQTKVMKKLGPLSNLLKMLPGFADIVIEENEFLRVESIISSMTKKERTCQKAFTQERLIKIANGSGNSLQKVVRLVENFERFRCAVQKLGASVGAERLCAILGDLKWP